MARCGGPLHITARICESIVMADQEPEADRARKGGRPRKTKDAAPARKARGFLRAGALSPQTLRAVGAKRGFAELKLITEWRAIAGEAVAAICRPVKVSYGRRAGPGLGATLVVAAEGARAPEVSMSAPRIIERVNAFYGYRAVSRLVIDQSRLDRLRRSPATAATGFAEDAAGWSGAPAAAAAPAAEPPPPIEGVADERLALALARLGANVAARAAAPEGPAPLKTRSLE
ncbi:MAG: DUF721 domain-containing protein [Pseudomonadota bacterium]